MKYFFTAVVGTICLIFGICYMQYERYHQFYIDNRPGFSPSVNWVSDNESDDYKIVNTKIDSLAHEMNMEWVPESTATVPGHWENTSHEVIVNWHY